MIGYLIYIQSQYSLLYSHIKTAWSELSQADWTIAQSTLDYTEETWNYPGYNIMEHYNYDSLTQDGKVGVTSLGMTPDVYDCKYLS